MAHYQPIHEIRPRLTGEFDITGFTPRTPAIAEAYRWGQELHAGQKRLSGEPYFETHCAWVAALIDRLVENEAWTIGALLHDSVEDRCGSLEQIRIRFPGPLGEEAATIVDGVTKLIASRNGHSRELETLRKITMYRNPGVFLVKLADKSHNVMTLEHMPPVKRRMKADEAIRAFGRLAGILNCYKWRRWLEDTAFPFADPETYTFVRDRVDSDTRLQTSFLNSVMEQMAKIMDKEGFPGRVEIVVNGYWQAWQKLRRMAHQRKASLDNFSAVNDMVSFRLILDSECERDCYALLSGVHRFFGPYLDQDRFDDYIACPQNGYRALQTTAWMQDYGAIEIAIASNAMEQENQWGIVYALRHGNDISHYNPVTFLTPSGSLRFVPEGSTVLDAVAAIQQEFLLEKASAVLVNDNLAKLSDKVNPGDVVEVITGGPRLKPDRQWLSYSNPNTARLLRALLATQFLKEAASTGRQKIKPVVAGRGLIGLGDLMVLAQDKMDQVLSQLGCANLDDLYAAIGGGAIRLEDLASTLNEVQVTKEALGWTSIQLSGSAAKNKPGVMARLTALVSDQGGNIMRLVTDTQPDGSFVTRLVVKGFTPEQDKQIIDLCRERKIPYDQIEVA